MHPLYNAYEQNSSMFCIVSFVKKRKGKWSHYLGRTVLLKKSGLFSGATSPHTDTGLFSGATCPHTLTLVYFQGRSAHTHWHWSIFRGDHPHTLTLVYFMGDLPKWKKRKSGRVVMGDLPKWRNGLIVMGDLPKNGKKEEWSCCNGWPTQVEEWSHCNGWPTQIKKHWELVAL